LHDSVQIEDAGTPSTVMITEPFQGLAASFAATVGMPDYHNIVVPHPISSADDETLRRAAKQVVETVVQQLVGDG
jgi:hypothetical protein